MPENEAIQTKEFKPLVKTNVNFYCVQNMLENGACKTERNFCLGRIINYLRDIEHYTQNQAFKVVGEFNKKCNPPKTDLELEKQFLQYWNGKYHLLGCKIADKNRQQILDKYCDKYACKTTITYEEFIVIEENRYTKVDNEYFNSKNMLGLSGYHYLIILILLDERSDEKETISIPQLKKKLINKSTKKIFIKDDELYSIITNLEEHGIIDSIIKGRTKYIEIKEIPNYCRGFTHISVAIRTLLINKIIKKNDLKVFLAIVYLGKLCKTCTREEIAKLSGLSERTVYNCIQRLQEAYALDCVLLPTESGKFYSRFTIKI